MSDRDIPTSRLGRIGKLLSAGARTGVTALFGGKEERVAKRAQKAAEAFGDMRALGAKAGQMLAYVDGVLPAEQQAIFAEHLKPLLEQTPTSSAQKVAALLRDELGEDPEDLFADFDMTPIASASLGQVHRATTHDGTDVAVKVQHPGIEDALRQDLKNAKLLEGVAAMVGARKFDSAAMLEEIRARFLEELDYILEASRQQAFRDFHADTPEIIIPAVHQDLSTDRVLTATFATGMSYDEATAHPDEGLRSQWCATLWRFYYESTLIAHMFNADPHPGNVRFREDGSVVFFDFGCVQTQPPDRSAKARRLHRAAARRDEATFYDASVDLMGLQGGAWEELATEYMRLCFEPSFASPFRCTTAYVRQVTQFLQNLKLDVITLRDDSFVPLEPGMLFINRLQFGFYSVLAGLDAPVDYAVLELSYLDRAPLDAPPC